MELSLSGTKVPEICRSRERKFPGAKVPVTIISTLNRLQVSPYGMGRMAAGLDHTHQQGELDQHSFPSAFMRQKADDATPPC